MDFRLSITDFSEHLTSLQVAGLAPAHNHLWQHGRLGTGRLPAACRSNK